MNQDFHIRRGANDSWIVHNQTGAKLSAFQRRSVAEAYGKALAHRAKVSLIVHHCSTRSSRFAERDLTYSVRI